jgi:putative ABC transport system ATP-binding protein
LKGATVRLEGVRRSYAAGSLGDVKALDGLDLDIPPGEFVSVEGPSGCGKTTLLNLIGLLDIPTSGRVFWGDRELSSLSERERTRGRLTGVGFIFQRFYLLPTLTASENVELPMRARGKPRGERQDRAAQLLEEVGLGPRSMAYPHELSGGEEQRVAIARALANDPPMLLADEPTGELDSSNTDRVLDLLDSIHRRHGATIVLVTHNPRVAQRAGRHLTMNDGRIVADVRGA